MTFEQEHTEHTKKRLKSLDELTIQDNYLFGTLLKDQDICREILQRILDIPIEGIRYPELRRFLDFFNGEPAAEDDPFLCKLEGKIQEIKSDQEWRKKYMIMSADYLDIRREGIQMGKEQGIQIGEARGEARGIERIARNMLTHGDVE